MKSTNIAVGAVAILTVVLGVVNFGKPVQVSVSPTPVTINVPQQETPIVNVTVPDVKVPATVVNVPQQTPTVGGVSGPDNYLPYWNLNGVYRYSDGKRFNAATTTVCSIKSPAHATSTLVNGLAVFDISSTTASTVTVAKATTPYATTTLIAEASVAANAKLAILFASTTLSALEQTNKTFAPGTWLVVGMAGGVGTFSPTGTCSAEFIAGK